MSETKGTGAEPRGGAGGRWTAWITGVLGIVALVGAFRLVGGLETAGVTAGVLLLVAALALLAVAVGQGDYGPDVEGRLDLSARIAAGLLGGALGGVAHLLFAWATGVAGLPDLFGVELAVWLGPFALAEEFFTGAIWGLVFGVLFPWIPGRGAIVRGLVFSALPALWMLLREYPGMKYGLFGVELGRLTFVVVALHHLVWGAVAGAVVRWAERTEIGPISRPLGV